MGGEAQLVGAAAGVVPQSGPPLLRVRPARGSSAEAEAVALSRATHSNVNEPSGRGLMDEAVDGVTECMEWGGATQLQFPSSTSLPVAEATATWPPGRRGAKPPTSSSHGQERAGRCVVEQPNTS